ncbi:hypothetical protein DW181_07535 [Clostridium sp. AM16-23]|nr:hypothetical protein DW181_07535 [Clostridium sp. AM16-23]RHR02153.1 hypothetical protein DWX64_12655 [Clostridium sp. AF20-17LB]RHS65650.1 hypothetical protein DW954_10275 [Clostridium sp. AM45-5]RHW02581.1 hypothetical protein DXA91_00765 [Clostridium sp. OF09-10]
MASVLSGGFNGLRTALEPSRHTLGFSQVRKYFVPGALNARSGAVKNLSQEHVLNGEMHEKQSF